MNLLNVSSPLRDRTKYDIKVRHDVNMRYDDKMHIDIKAAS